LVESTKDSIISIDPDGAILSWNTGSELIFNYRRDEIIGKNASILVPDDLKNEQKEILHKIISTKKCLHIETYRLNKDNKRIPVELSLSPLIDKNDQVIGITGIIKDISERKKVEKALLESEAHFKSLLENPTDYVIYRLGLGNSKMNPEVIMVSPIIIDFLGIEKSDLNDISNWFKNIHPDDYDRVISSHIKGFEPPFKFEETFRYNHPNKGIIWVKVNSTGVTDSNGDIIYANGLILEVTSEKKATAELNNKIAELEKINKLMIGRENRMIELKSEVNEICKQFGLAERYEAPKKII
jgi:PAS domain S-box-containing protein